MDVRLCTRRVHGVRRPQLYFRRFRTGIRLFRRSRLSLDCPLDDIKSLSRTCVMTHRLLNACWGKSFSPCLIDFRTVCDLTRDSRNHAGVNKNMDVFSLIVFGHWTTRCWFLIIIVSTSFYLGTKNVRLNDIDSVFTKS